LRTSLGHALITLPVIKRTINNLLSILTPERIQHKAILVREVDPILSGLEEKPRGAVMTAVTHQAAAMYCMWEKRLPLGVEQTVFLTHRLVAHDISKISQKLRADRADQAPFIETERRGILQAQIGTTYIIGRGLIVAQPEILLQRTICKTDEKSAILLCSPRRMTSIAFELLHVRGDTVFNYLQVGFVTVTAGFRGNLISSQAGHAVTVAALEVGPKMHVGTHFEVMLAIVSRTPLVTQGIFPWRHAVVIGSNIIAAMAGIAVVLFRQGDIMTGTPMTVKAGLNVAAVAVSGEKPRIGLFPTIIDKIFFRLPPRHRPV